MKVKSLFLDIIGTSQVTRRRKLAIKNASSTPDGKDNISDTARFLHPGKQLVKLVSVKEVSFNRKRFTFKSVDKPLPYFKPGQFMTLELTLSKACLTRPFLISSSPEETKGNEGIIEIDLIRDDEDEFLMHLYHEAQVEDIFQAEIPLGQFFYEPLRDSSHIIAIANNRGISSYLSMAKEIKNGHLDLSLTILYLEEKIEPSLIEEIKNHHLDQVDIIPCSTKDYKDILKPFIQEDCSYFISGEEEFVLPLKKELLSYQIKERRIRLQITSLRKDITSLKDYPIDLINKEFTIKVHRGIRVDEIKAKASESLATALEKAGMKIHTACRCGYCGVCRIKILEGEYYINPDNDYRRIADKDFAYVHACITYPLSDMSIRMNIPDSL